MNLRPGCRTEDEYHVGASFDERLRVRAGQGGVVVERKHRRAGLGAGSLSPRGETLSASVFTSLNGDKTQGLQGIVYNGICVCASF